MNEWLQNFAYHIKLNIWHIATPLIIILLISFITVSFQIIKTGNTNPAKALRYE